MNSLEKLKQLSKIREDALKKLFDDKSIATGSFLNSPLNHLKKLFDDKAGGCFSRGVSHHYDDAPSVFPPPPPPARLQGLRAMVQASICVYLNAADPSGWNVIFLEDDCVAKSGDRSFVIDLDNMVELFKEDNLEEAKRIIDVTLALTEPMVQQPEAQAPYRGQLQGLVGSIQQRIAQLQVMMGQNAAAINQRTAQQTMDEARDRQAAHQIEAMLKAGVLAPHHLEDFQVALCQKSAGAAHIDSMLDAVNYGVGLMKYKVTEHLVEDPVRVDLRAVYGTPEP